MTLDLAMDPLCMTTKAPAKKRGGVINWISPKLIFLHTKGYYEGKEHTIHRVGENIFNSYIC